MNKNIENELENLRRENIYLKKMAENSTAKILKMDEQSIAMRYELEYKRRGFQLMSELAVNLSLRETDHEHVFVSVSKRINSALNMHRTVVLMRDAEPDCFKVYIAQGYPIDEQPEINSKKIYIEPELLKASEPIIITGEDLESTLSELRKELKLPYLILSPVVIHDNVVAVLVTGRLVEQAPWMLRLDRGNAEIIQAVSAYLAAMLTGYRLQKAEDEAGHDPLTKLPNLRRTKEEAFQIIDAAQRNNFISAIMFLDLDGFKQINDGEGGHQAGDEVLKVTAERMVQCVRGSDLVGRIGGDEFVICLPRVKSKEGISLVAGKLLEKISETIDFQGIIYQVTASIGIAVFPEHGKTWDELVNAADKAMYVTKNNGKNAFGFAE